MTKMIAIVILCLLPMMVGNAQQISSGRITGLGGMSASASTDVDAIGTNPANLLYPSNGGVVFELAPVSVNAGTNFLSLGMYNNYFTGTGQTDSAGNAIGRFLTANDKQTILDAFPDGTGTVRFGSLVRLLAFSVDESSFAFGVSVDVNGGGGRKTPEFFTLPAGRCRTRRDDIPKPVEC